MLTAQIVYQKKTSVTYCQFFKLNKSAFFEETVAAEFGIKIQVFLQMKI